MSAQRKQPPPHLRVVTNDGEAAPPAPLANREIGLIHAGRMRGCFVVPQHWAGTRLLTEPDGLSDLMLFMWAAAFMDIEPVSADEFPDDTEGDYVRYRAVATADDFNAAVDTLCIMARWTPSRAKKWLSERVRDGLVRLVGAQR